MKSYLRNLRDGLGRLRRAPIMVTALALMLVLASCTGAAQASPADQSTPVSSPTPGSEKSLVNKDGMDGATGGAGQSEATPTVGPTKPPAPATVDRTRTYQWVGTVVVSDIEGRHLQLDRGCDRWVLLGNAEVVKKLEQNIGNKVVIWGRVHDGPTIYQRQAIDVQSAFGPNDPMPMTLVAIPEYPCPGTPKPPTPVPSGVQLNSGEVAARGRMKWEDGAPTLMTTTGTILLELPPTPVTPPTARTDGQGSPGSAAGLSEAPFPTGDIEVVAVGRWYHKGESLRIQARVVRPWPTQISISVACSSRMVSLQLQPGEIAAAGSLARDGDKNYLKTESGPVTLYVPVAPEAPPLGDAVVSGQWKMAPEGLTMSVRSVVSRGQKCPPPPPAQPPLQPGEIAARGTLVREKDRAWLSTPAGRIVLEMAATTRDGPSVQPERPPQADAGAVASNSEAIVVGKWFIRDGQLVIVVRSVQTGS